VTRGTVFYGFSLYLSYILKLNSHIYNIVKLIMGKCDFCGNDEAMPYRCKYCGGFFCSAHRLPENHNCMGMKKSLSLPSKVIVYSEKDENFKKNYYSRTENEI